MKRSDPPSGSIPRHDYDLALKNAVSWMGDRYLLAAPLQRRSNEPKGYFIEPRRWHEGTSTAQVRAAVRLSTIDTAAVRSRDAALSR
jgi:hypothetical protein